MGRARQSVYEPVYKEKYVGQYPITARRNWERDFMVFCDMNDDVLEWASEPVIDGRMGLPYRCPLTGRQTIYIPDFLVTIRDAKGHIHKKLVEIKPLHEAVLEYTRNDKDRDTLTKNLAKWEAARQWCERRGIEFVVMTEQQLFSGHENQKPRRQAVRKPGRKKKT